MKIDLQLNTPVRIVDYKTFEGNAVDQLPLLFAEGRRFLSVHEVWMQRLAVSRLLRRVREEYIWADYGQLGSREVVVEYFTKLRDYWWNTAFAVSDGYMRHPDGGLKLILDAPYLIPGTSSWVPAAGLVNGAVPLSDEFYRDAEGIEFSAQQVDEHSSNRPLNRPLSREEAHRNPVLLFLYKRHFVNDIVDAVFDEAEKHPEFKNVGKEMMGIFVPPAKKFGLSQEGVEGCFLKVYGFGDYIGSAGVDCIDGVLDKPVTLIGSKVTLANAPTLKGLNEMLQR